MLGNPSRRQHEPRPGQGLGLLPPSLRLSPAFLPHLGPVPSPPRAAPGAGPLPLSTSAQVPPGETESGPLPDALRAEERGRARAQGTPTQAGSRIDPRGEKGGSPGRPRRRGRLLAPSSPAGGLGKTCLPSRPHFLPHWEACLPRPRPGVNGTVAGIIIAISIASPAPTIRKQKLGGARLQARSAPATQTVCPLGQRGRAAKTSWC